MEEILIPITFFAMIFGIIYVTRSAKNKERMSLIDKGLPPEEIAKLFNDKQGKGSLLASGLLLIGVPVGLILGYFLQAITSIEPEMAYIACAFLFGGVGLVVAHYLIKKEQEKLG